MNLTGSIFSSRGLPRRGVVPEQPLPLPLAPMARPISGHTALAGVLGDPVRHSLSPAMHNAALAALGLEWAYLALPAPAADLATVVRALEAMGCRGLSVTIPHKQAVAELCRERSPLAQRVGAVNTLVPLDGGGWMGTNTDVEGFIAPLRHGPWQGKRAVVLGCGGSARAVVAGLVLYVVAYAFRYFISGLSSAGRRNGSLPISSSLTGILKRSRKARSASSSSFFCWWAVFCPSPALPIPKPLTVCAKMTVGPPLCAMAAA